MIHQNDEALLADESFINFCLGRNDADVLKWNRLLMDNPTQAARIEELQAIVAITSKNIHETEISNQFAALEVTIAQHEVNLVAEKEAVTRRHRLRWFLAAASFLVFFTTVAIYYLTHNATDSTIAPLLYSTQPAEKKELTLPDGSRVILNADSRVTISADFGKKERRVQLNGEAFFDVTHDSLKPFIVETPRMDIKVLGTAFNVKAYPADRLAETSLIRGSIQLSLKEEQKTVTLRPNEKYVLSGIQTQPSAVVKSRNRERLYSETGLLPVKISTVDTSVVEVAWTRNTIAFIDEPFGEVVKKLERWYAVQIIIEDETLSPVRYTGSFRNEQLGDVLAALQFSKPFTYSRQDNVIRINK